MTQFLSSQPNSTAAMNVRRQRDPERPHASPDLSSAKRNRNWGVILSRQGWQKLMQAGVLCDKLGYRYTYEQLSERSLLEERTVSRLLSCEVKVDKRTLKTFFQAFNLSLEAVDYLSFKRDKNGTTTPDATADMASNR